MIAVCGGLMRTGSIAMWQVMREIVLKGDGNAPKLGTYFFKYSDTWAKKDKYTLIKTHDYHSSLADPIKNKRCKVVVTIRDQRDVVVSLMNFNDYGFDKAIAARAFKGNVKNYYEWIDKVPDDDLLIVKYEDFIGDRTTTILEVAEFLEINIAVGEAKKIDRKWNIQANRKRAKDKHKIDSHNYMAGRHINSGEAEQWKTALTQEQVAYIEEELGKWFVSVGYSIHCHSCGELHNREELVAYKDHYFYCDACCLLSGEEE